ncbi:MAG: hypothetical protein QM770_21525 [Tepidisphaeraceae bacterium]
MQMCKTNSTPTAPQAITGRAAAAVAAVRGIGLHVGTVDAANAMLAGYRADSRAAGAEAAASSFGRLM